MRIKTTLVVAFLIMQIPAFTQLCAINRPGLNLCDGGQGAYLTNTTTSITIHDAGRVPTTGNYTVTISYYKQSANACQPILNCTGFVSSSGNNITISLSGCTVPANFSTEGIIYINLTAGPGGAQYFFHIYGGSCMLPLPIHISNFEVFRIQTASQYAIKVRWTADIEDNASHVIIMRNSVAGQYVFDFEIGRVDVDHSTSPPHTYEFIDYYPLNGVNWYTLKLVDIDGSIEYYNPPKSASCPDCQYSAPWIDCSSYAITGPDHICQGSANYTFSYPAPLYYNKFNWSLTTYNGGLDATTTPSVSLTKNYEGDEYLNLSISRCSPNTRNKIKYVQLGSRPVTGLFYPGGPNGNYGTLVKDMSGTNYVPTGNVWVYPTFYGTNPSWSFMWGNVSQWTGNGSNLQFYMPPGGDCTFKIDYTSEYCGAASEMFTFMEGADWFYRMSPNPASSQLSISVKEPTAPNAKVTTSLSQPFQEVIVLDKMGNTVMRQKHAANTRNISLNISSLKTDTYTVRIYNGKKWVTLKFIKQ